MYQCIDCNIEFNEPLQFEEYRGECHGTPAYENFYGCPCCGGGFDEIEQEKEV